MLLKINGQNVMIPEHIRTVEQLLEHLNIAHKLLVVERNKSILSKNSYLETVLFDGDQIEIVTFVGGG
ncbi:sulfur carrier protein ThiS [Ectobacillus antri]|uniref:Sulfur carrier protein ThiS n=1 Tax=Ectobacillus antri TaxID=2486280 RepID=A0ABT6H7B4_9BACI|nr:sulfur carrier protein ThiS [Ectobacillus antri]MDG4658171.1 sulfur carrier protein ThiS [Ectobacillus antri]MDG5755235.1 sulfur carrier protein ThiS [Ectobacillus antri]